MLSIPLKLYHSFLKRWLHWHCSSIILPFMGINSARSTSLPLIQYSSKSETGISPYIQLSMLFLILVWTYVWVKFLALKKPWSIESVSILHISEKNELYTFMPTSIIIIDPISESLIHIRKHLPIYLPNTERTRTMNWVSI